MYYLFLNKKDELEQYKDELDRIICSLEEGKTPVFSEVRSAKTNLFESLPYNILNALFLIFGTILLNKISMPEIIKVAAVLVINSIFGAIANFIFTIAKHRLRIRLCRRLSIEPSERNIAAMESLEYQTV